MQACNAQFMAIGARGVSILFASGDMGVYGRTGPGLSHEKPFHPDFPAASPYITAVGGTDFVTMGVVGPEKAWSAGGGGFSNAFAIPAFQTDAVAAYKASADANLPAQKLWNNTGRGYPDIRYLSSNRPDHSFYYRPDGTTIFMHFYNLELALLQNCFLS